MVVVAVAEGNETNFLPAKFMSYSEPTEIVVDDLGWSGIMPCLSMPFASTPLTAARRYGRLHVGGGYAGRTLDGRQWRTLHPTIAEVDRGEEQLCFISR